MKKIAVLLGAVGMMLMSCEVSNPTPDRVKATFVNYDNSVLYVTSLAYDGTAVYQGDTPTRPTSSESHHYVFSGWDQSLEHIKIDTTFIAQYTEEINTYTVEFKNYDDSLLQSTQVKHGEDVVYSADTPVREATKQFTYTFDGWDKPLTNITSSQVIHAQFMETVNQYTVTFQNEDGAVLGTSTVDYGGTAVYEGATPAKESTESHHFEFVGWDISLENIQDDCVATAQFKSEINQYTVRFLNYDSSELAVVTVDYDGTAVYSGEDPVKPGDQQYSYSFNGWNLPLDHVTSDREVVAQFTETVNQYTVTFYNDDGTRLGTSTVEYGGTAVYEGPDPEKEGTAKYSYAFTGWDKSLENITEDCDRYAVFVSSINSYTVTFKNYDGSVLSEETVQYGDDVFYRGDTPMRARTQQYTYTFTGWDGSLEGIVCDTTLTAQYEETVNQYTVTFKDWDGTVLYTSTVDYDGTATYNLDDPARENTQQYTYTFTGWDISLENIQDDCVATAQYLETTNQYTVTFKDWDGTILDTVTVDYGTAATYSKENPAREETQQYSYAFSGWDIALTEITENCVATAQYITTTKQYTVTFKNYDGTILGASTVDYGDTAAYDGEVPTKPENQQYSYTFSGWSISLENITGNCEAVAQFENVVKQYTVTFKNYDGSVLDTILVNYGSDAVYPKADPTRPATQQYTYTFTGWDISLNNITGNSIATAQYSSTVNQYTVTFKNYDGTVLGTKTVDYGTAATYTGEDPIKPATAKYSYVFNGWDAQINSITEDCVRIATFTEVTNKYTVTFKNYDGSVLGTSTVEYGNAASYQGNTPTRAKTQQYTYTFSGWDISLENVTSDRIATAQYNSTVNQYTVTFKNYDGSVLGTSTVDYGSTAVYGGTTPIKPATQQYSYSFSGWDKALSNVTEDYSVVAQFSPITNKYTVTFKNWDGSILGTSTVEYGETATYSGSNPVKESTAKYNYSFSGWDISLEDVTSDRVATALFASTIRQYTVTFKNYDGTVLETSTVNYGETATYSGSTPTRPKDSCYTYAFGGWDSALDNITDNKVVTAVYNSNPNKYTITVQADQPSRGSVSVLSGDGYYGESITVKASVNGNYIFDGWYNQAYRISSEATFTFQMPASDYSLVAHFLTIAEKGRADWISTHSDTPIVSGSTVKYGIYPQTNVNDGSLLTALNSLGNDSIDTNNGWYYYNGEYYAKKTTDNLGNPYAPFDNGATVQANTTYWFKCEPISWKIMQSSSGEYFLIAEKILDAHMYNTYYEGLQDGHYCNNYEYSEIRRWLNDDFFNLAFGLCGQHVKTTEVNNTIDGNQYACDNTFDKVFLPSTSEMNNSSYGFSNQKSRMCKSTDWAKANGAWCSTRSDCKYYGNYWTRTPWDRNCRIVYEVDADGGFQSNDLNNQYYGVRPSIRITK